MSLFLADTPCQASSFGQFWLALALIGVPGILGGLVTGVAAYLKDIDVDKSKWPPSGHLGSWLYFGAQGVTGFGGAIAALLVTLWAQRFPKNIYETESSLFLMATGFVAGYIANRLLPTIAESFYNKLAKLAEKTEDNDAKLDVAAGKIVDLQIQQKKTALLSTELVSASRYLAGGNFTESQSKVIKDSLAALILDFPLNRTLTFLLNKLLADAFKNRDAAVDVLECFLKAKKDAGEAKDDDVASAYWNLANDRIEQFRESKGTLPKRREQAIQALDQALAINPVVYLSKLQGGEGIVPDPDLAEIVDSPEGQELIERHKRKVLPEGRT